MSTASRQPDPLGGYFALDPAIWDREPALDPEAAFGLRPGRHLWVSTARAGLALLLGRLAGRGLVLLPELLCGRIILDVVEGLGLAWRTYPVTADLGVDWTTLDGLAGPETRVVLAINYFGVVDQGPGLARFKARRPEVFTILDCVMDPHYALAVGPGEQPADALLTSFRKTFPVPDGGFVRLGPGADVNLEAPAGPPASPDAWLAGALLKHAFMQGGASTPALERAFLAAFARADVQVSPAVLAGSSEGRGLLARQDLEDAAQRRRANYAQVAAALPATGPCRPIHPDLSAGQAPSHLPVLVGAGERDALRGHLARAGIYCPVHWPLDPRLEGALSATGRRTYQDILSLVIDQRWGRSDMERLIKQLQSFAREGRR